MGLLSFLAKKHGLDTPASRSVRAPAYDPIVSSSGARGLYPVAGSGPNVLGGLARIPYSLPRQMPHLDDESAPAPIIRLLKEEDEISLRPTSPYDYDTQSIQSQVSRPPTRLRKEPPAVIPQIPGARRAIGRADRSLSLERSRRGQADAASVHASIDILDAQSQLKPSDFQGRVQAAGVRDYGEDVADRNLDGNGGDPGWSEGQEYYDASLDATSRTRSLNLASFQPRNRDMPVNPQITYSSARTYSLGGRSFIGPDDAQLRYHRRQSMNSYVPPRDSGSAGPWPSRRSSHQAGSRLQSHARTHLYDPLSQISEQEAYHDAYELPTRTVLVGPDGPEPVSKQLASMESLYGTSRSGHRGPRGPPSASHTPKRHSLQTFQTSRSSSVSSRDTAVMSSHTGLSHPRGRPRGRVPEMIRAPRLVVEGVEIDCVPESDLESAPPPSVKTRPSRSEMTSSTKEPPKALAKEQPSKAPVPEPRRQGDKAKEPSMTPMSSPTTASSGSNASQRPVSRHTANTSIDVSNQGLSCGSDGTVSDPGEKVPTTPGKEGGRAPQARPQPNNGNSFNIDDYLSSDDDSFLASPRDKSEPEGLLFRNSGYGFDGDRLPGLFDGSEPDKQQATHQQQQQQRPEPQSDLPIRPVSEEARVIKPAGRPDPYSLHGVYSRPRPRYVVDVDADDWDETAEAIYDHPANPGVVASDGFYYYLADEEEGIRRDLSPLRGPRGSNRLSAIGYSSHGLHHGGGGPGYGYGAPPPGFHHHHQPHEVSTVEEELGAEDKLDVATAVRLRKQVKARQRVRGVSTPTLAAAKMASRSNGTLGRRRGGAFLGGGGGAMSFDEMDALSAVGTGEDADDELFTDH